MIKNKTPRLVCKPARGEQQKNSYIEHNPDAPYGQGKAPSITLHRQGETSTCNIEVIPTITNQHIAASSESSLTTLVGYRDIDRCKLSKSRQLSLLDWQGPRKTINGQGGGLSHD
jgi:hypothetical protein